MDGQLWRMSTFVFYIGIILACFLIASVPDRKAIVFGNSSFRLKINMLIPFTLLFLLKGLAMCGTDLIGGYLYNFNAATSISDFRDKSTELGYQIFTVIVRNITDNYQVYLLIVAFITLFPVLYVVQKNKNYLNVPIVIMSYAAIYFFPGICLIRIYIAASFCFLSFGALLEKKYIRAIIWVLIASLFHVSALIMIVPCLLLVFKMSKKIFACGIVVALGALYATRSSWDAFMQGRYVGYSSSATVEIGTEFIWFYIPLVLLYIYIWRIRKHQTVSSELTRVLDISFIWILIGIFISLLQYAIPIFGRMIAYTIPLIIFMGVAMMIMKLHSQRFYKLVYLIGFIYLILRFIIYITGYYASEGIMPYINCFGLEI